MMSELWAVDTTEDALTSTLLQLSGVVFVAPHFLVFFPNPTVAEMGGSKSGHDSGGIAERWLAQNGSDCTRSAGGFGKPNAPSPKGSVRPRNI